jgi:hypothetical protein
MILSETIAADLAAAFARQRGPAGYTADELAKVLNYAEVVFMAAAVFDEAVKGKVNLDVKDGAIDFYPNNLPAADALAKSAADAYRNWRSLWYDMPVMTWFRDAFTEYARKGMALVGGEAFIALLFAELGVSDTAGSINDRCSMGVLLNDLRDLARGVGILADQWKVKRVGADEDDEPRVTGQVERAVMPDEAERRNIAGTAA